jgi:hypothetical protein
MNEKPESKYLIDILGRKMTPGDICAFSVRGWGMELGVFVKETPKKISFRIPCWWCASKEEYSVSSINKRDQHQKVLVLENPLFHLDSEKVLILFKLREILINKGIIEEVSCDKGFEEEKKDHL